MRMFRKIQHLHFVGIGGSGMSGIAEVLLTLGYTVTGSDLVQSDITRHVESLGGRIFIGHQAAHIEGAQVVVISSAVQATNPEVVAAQARVIPVIPRAEMLAELMRLKFGIAIAGAHGKTTTTSLVAAVLAHAGLDPTFVVGGKVNAVGTHARLGRSDVLIAEADESDGSFLRLSPSIAVITNMDREHLDHYGTLDQLEAAFLEFANKVPFYGVAILCSDNPAVRTLFPRMVKRYLSYGLNELADGSQPDVRATDIAITGRVSNFRAQFCGKQLGLFRLNSPGLHNVSNALAALAVALELDLSVDLIRKGLAAFSGVERRFHIRGAINGIVVVDDYGHHPTEIRCTIAAAKTAWSGRLIVLFQPHRYSRTQDLAREFAEAFEQADVVYITDIYAAGERPIPGVSGNGLAQHIQAMGHPAVTWIERKEEFVRLVLPTLGTGDVVLTLGAGDIWKVGLDLLECLRTP